MRNKNVVFYLLLIFIFLTIIITNALSSSKRNQSYNKNYSLEANLQINRIKGINISFIRNVFKENKFFNNKNNLHFLIIFREYNCRDCVQKIFKKKINYYILYLSDNTNEHYIESEYNKKEEDINFYLKKIKYIKTPVILKFDSTFKVLDAFFPTIHKDEEFKGFIDKWSSQWIWK